MEHIDALYTPARVTVSGKALLSRPAYLCCEAL
jgi:hypothetical protein